jgi:hypothetical protein
MRDELIAIIAMAPDPPPPPRLEDRLLVALFVFFSLYKGFRLVKTTRLGWSFATYNFVLAFLFSLAIFFLPFADFPAGVESGALTAARGLLVLAILWCVIEVEVSRRDLIEFGQRRRGGGQQT